MKLPSFSISTKLYAIFALLATVTVALAAVAVFNAHRHTVLTAEFKSANAGAINVERVNTLIYAMVMESRGIYMSTDPAAVKVFSNGLAAFNQRLGELVDEWRKSVGPEDVKQFEIFATRIGQFRDFRRELARLAVEFGPQAARQSGDNDANRNVRKALNSDIDGLDDLYSARSADIYREIDRGISRTAWLLSLLATSAVLLAGVGALIIWRAVARPLSKITAVTEAVAAGAKHVVVPYGERGDEVGALARSIAIFQAAMDRNEELSRRLMDEERMRHQKTVDAEIGRFGTDVEATLAELGRISSQMLVASTQLTGAADHASNRTSAVSVASAEATANVHDIASAADELATSVGEIDRQVAHANDIASKAVGEAEWTNATVKELNEAAGRIGDVVSLITDIAEQTNLLALNATIEAARAGDAGRGFAVVAGEVKALAGQTAKATKDIGAQITGMQQASTRSIEALGAIEHTIRQIGDISGAIAAAVTEQDAATQEIARSVERAATRTQETATEVARAGEATQATRDSASTVKAVAGDLEKVAARIRGQVDQFFRKLRAA